MAAVAYSADSAVVAEEQGYPTLLQSKAPRTTPAVEDCKAAEKLCEDLFASPEVSTEEGEAEPKAEEEVLVAVPSEEATWASRHREEVEDEEDEEDEHEEEEGDIEAEAEAEEAESPEVEAERLARAEAAKQRAADDEFFWRAAQMALQERERREKVGAFLKAHKFTGVNTRRGWYFSYDYPLHCAARHADVEMVRLLLKSKAVRKQRDSEGRTARQIARRENYHGSHAAVIKALTGRRRKKAQAPALATAAAIVGAAAGAGAATVATGLSRNEQEKEASEKAAGPTAGTTEAAGVRV